MTTSVYPRIAGIALRQQTQYIGATILRNLFFLLQIFIFASIWRVVYAETNLIAGFSMVQCVWYMTFTEAVELSKARLMVPIQTEVKDGAVAYNLLRPYSYVEFYLARGMGESLVVLVPILVFGFGAASLLAGPLPGYWMAIGPGLLLILGGIILALLIQIMVGLLSFWIEESTPVYWIIQKAVFILGGLFFPIDFFPEWLADVSKTLPFAYMTYWPARLLVNFDPELWISALGIQFLYIVLFLLCAHLLFKAGTVKLESNGG